jgi:hypothetical protein
MKIVVYLAEPEQNNTFMMNSNWMWEHIPVL